MAGHFHRNSQLFAHTFAVRSGGNAKDDLESPSNGDCPPRSPDNFTEQGVEKKGGRRGWKGEEECNFTYARLGGQGRDFHREVFFMPRTGTICHFVISWKNLKFLRFRFSFYLVLFKFNNRLVCASGILLSKVAAVYCNRLTSFRFNNKAKLELSKDRIVIGEMMIIREESWERKFPCFFLCIMPIRPLIALLFLSNLHTHQQL